MSAATATAERWLCDRCGVSVGLLNGAHTALPSGWIRHTDGQFCLTCGRERAAEAAVENAPVGSDHVTRAKLRRDAILEFELTREPERPNAKIAQACRATAPAVAAARKRLGLPEVAPPAPVRRRAVASRRAG